MNKRIKKKLRKRGYARNFKLFRCNEEWNKEWNKKSLTQQIGIAVSLLRKVYPDMERVCWLD